MAARLREEFAGFAEFTYRFIGATPGFLDDIPIAGKAPPHPSINQPMGEVNASLAKPARARCKGNEREARITDRR